MGKYCEAVELLLARMDSNPEEFTENGRWEKLIAKWKPVLSAPDRMALEGKLNTLWLEVFHKDVMNELLAEPSEDAVVDRGYYQSTIPTGALATAIPRTTGNAALAGQQLSPSALSNANANALNLSSQSIKDIAAAMSQYAANTWKP